MVVRKISKRELNKTVILYLIKKGILIVENSKVYKNGRLLTQRKNKRRRSISWDPRIDICYRGRNMGINLSQLTWMYHYRQVIPVNFEIHHLDEDSLNNDISNLIAIHKCDHYKLHTTPF
jgi:hypothetical protein